MQLPGNPKSGFSPSPSIAEGTHAHRGSRLWVNMQVLIDGVALESLICRFLPRLIDNESYILDLNSHQCRVPENSNTLHQSSTIQNEA